jgi:hypothetical protein
MKTGAELIAEERKRQIEVEGWTAAHDDQHGEFPLPKAAVAYVSSIYAPLHDVPPIWPWAEDWWKPTPDDPVRQLTKAGALIAAEIDRRLRQKK